MKQSMKPMTIESVHARDGNRTGDRRDAAHAEEDERRHACGDEEHVPPADGAHHVRLHAHFGVRLGRGHLLWFVCHGFSP